MKRNHVCANQLMNNAKEKLFIFKINNTISDYRRQMYGPWVLEHNILHLLYPHLRNDDDNGMSGEICGFWCITKAKYLNKYIHKMRSLFQN